MPKAEPFFLRHRVWAHSSIPRTPVLFLCFSLAVVLPLGCQRETTSELEPVTTTSPAGVDVSIRALLMDDVTSCELILDAPADVIDPRSGAVLCRLGQPGRCIVRFQPEGILLEGAPSPLSVPVAEITPSGSAPLQVVFPRGPRRYAGTLRLIQRSPTVGVLVNVVDLEQYLVGVVTAEIPRSFHPEAFRAQAIASRTYAWYAKRMVRAGREWDVWSNESSQMYVGLGRDDVTPPAIRAVRSTRGLVCTWDGPEGERIFCTYYSSTCGGSTQAAGPVKNEPIIPPLAGGVACDWCRHSPDYRWGPVRLEKSRVTEALRERYPRFAGMGPVDRLEVTDRTPSGRPVRLTIYDEATRRLELEAENFRLSVDPSGREIKSTFFQPIIEAGAIVLTDGRGFGHGIGMCQYGADGLARAGRNAFDILSFYYPSCRITRAY